MTPSTTHDRHPTPHDLKTVGLTTAEYAEIVRRLGRDPNPLELQLFGVMWSEHCGYKHSKLTLKSLPADAPHVLAGPGGNAGVLNIGGGWAVAFKMESHNHPSAVDPSNGAATGVGGILRDVLSMGARPVALLDSLRFGPPDDPRVRRLAVGVVSGIAAYGNCVGVPTVGGEILIDDRYRQNPLVNVACLGLLRADRLATARAEGPGNLVMYVGARTGRDGMGGAAFASEELDEHSARDDRSAVQIGDPFTGKLLIEATLAALSAGGIVALQDMGAAGLICAASEMATRGGVGMSIDLDRVPLRETGMRADEILRSESQERMLFVVTPDAARRLAAIVRRWGLHGEIIGEVLADAELRVRHQGRTVLTLAPYTLAEAPVVRPVTSEPQQLARLWAWAPPEEAGPQPALRRLLAAPDIGSKRAVFEQYDYSVQVRTVLGPGAADAAVLRVRDLAPRGLALTVDGSGGLCALDPYRGTRRAVAEAAANLACVGATPIGVTDCLNFGNPDDPEVFWTFRRAVAGIADACRSLRVPVVGGNVSFYNESPDGPVPPTPVIAMVGTVEDVSRARPLAFQAEGHLIVLVGDPPGALAASSYLQIIHGLNRGRPADVDFELHRRVLDLVREGIARGWLRAAHDCAEGGMAVAIAECAIAGGIGAEVTFPDSERVDAILFGETPSRIVVSLENEHLGALRERAAAYGVPLHILGRTGGGRLQITVNGTRVIDAAVGELAHAYESLSEVFA